MRWAMAIAIFLHGALLLVGLRNKKVTERYFLVEPRLAGVERLSIKRALRPLSLPMQEGESELAATAPGATPQAPSRLSVSDIINWGNPPPDYPFTAIQKGWEGTVEVRLHGSEVTMVVSSGYRTLDEAALRWARQCQVPADLRSSDILVPIVYRLEN